MGALFIRVAIFPNLIGSPAGERSDREICFVAYEEEMFMKQARQIVLVTGAGSGIGRAIALELSGGGYYIIIACRSRANALDTLAQLRRAGGGYSA